MRLWLAYFLSTLLILTAYCSEASASEKDRSAFVSESTLSITNPARANDGCFEKQWVKFHNDQLRLSTNSNRNFLYTPTGYTGANLSAFDTLVSSELSAGSYNLCVPIGQKLLYPKHYFW